jgi:hypothetical protein
MGCAGAGGIFQNLCSCILYRVHRLDLLYGLDLCPCIFLGCPSLELPEQDFSRRLIIFRLTLIGGFRGGSNFAASRSAWVARRITVRICSRAWPRRDARRGRFVVFPGDSNSERTALRLADLLPDFREHPATRPDSYAPSTATGPGASVYAPGFLK